MEKSILEKLEQIEKEYLECQEKLANPDSFNDSKLILDVNKFIKKNEEKFKLFQNWKNLNSDILEANQIIKIETDQELITEFKNLISKNKSEIIKIENLILELLVEKDPNDERDVIVEMQGAAGGNESKIFVGDLFKAYLKYFSKLNFEVEIIEEQESETGGFSFLSFYVRGIDVYKYLKYESGVHRVQRIPVTETQGRVHTSTIIVSVMPEADEFDVEINPSDLRIDTYRSGGKGGQHANKTDSAVRITHLPTGIVAQSQDGRSQHHNKDIALQLIRSRIFEIKLNEEAEKNSLDKKNLVGTGDRSEKIRTYNYPQNRITDHRIGLTIKKLDRIMEGNFNEIIDPLILNNK